MARARGGPRMRKHWVGTTGTAVNFTGAGVTLLQQLGGTGGLADAFTVLRMLGEYTIFPTSATAQGDEGTITVGIGVVSSDAATVGSTAMPDPGDDHGFPWLYWASHPIASNGTLEESALANMSVRKVFDIKSMRKIKPSESLISVAQYANIGSGGDPPLTLAVGGWRVLLAH